METTGSPDNHIVGADGIPRRCMSSPWWPPLHLLGQSWGPNRLLLTAVRQSRWILNSLGAKSVLAGKKLVATYSIFYVGIVCIILRETKTWCAKIYLPTQCTNREYCTILTSKKKIQFWPSTHIIDEARFVNIASNSCQAEVIARSTSYRIPCTD